VRSRRLSASLLLVSCLVGFAALARADEVTGTWTGNVEAWGNYYWERSTRVFAPDVRLRLESPRGVELQAGYLIDAITSASQAAGALTDHRFTEMRHDVTLGAGYELGVGENQLHLAGTFRVSREPDYTSASGSVQAALALDDRSTVLRAELGVLHDEVRQNFRGGTGVRPSADGGTSADQFAEHINAVRGAVGWEQVLSPNAYFQLGYELTYLNGYLGNPYRQVSVAGVLTPETHPGDRLRHTLTGHLAYFIGPTDTALHLLYRAYVDSWHVAAITPEVRVYQRIARYASVLVRHRYYRQNRAFFYQPNPADYTSNDRYVSADPKMSAFHSHLFGWQLALDLSFLQGTALERLAAGSISLDFSYMWRTNRYGDAITAQIGASMPF
jgi:hypothetical protein